jgi:epoxyqueuosine reductase
MSETLKKSIIEFLKPRVTDLGFASVDRFAGAPEAHHPKRVCRGAETVIVFGITVPQGVLRSPDYNLYALHRSYHSAYMRIDEISLDLCNYIESQGKYLAVPIPSYAPMVFHQLEPWGIMSLKHAAVNAGMGRFGRSGQAYHPQYGSLLRLGAVVTDAVLDADPLLAPEPCPPGCNACLRACPAKAFDEDGKFNKMTCLGHTIKHAIYPLALNSEAGLKKIERIINTAGITTG